MTGKDARKRNKAQKQSYKQNYLQTDKRQHSNNSSDGSGSDSKLKDTVGKSGTASRPPGANNKKVRTFNDEKDMNQDFALSSNSPDNSEQFYDAENTLSVDANLQSTSAATAGASSTTPAATPADTTPRDTVPNKETVHSDGTSANKENSF